MDFWDIRNLRVNCKIKLLKKICSFIYYRILEREGSFIGILAEFKNKPIFPHGPLSVFISNGARIGCNCVIAEDIGSNTVVVLNKPRKIKKSRMDNTYYPYGVSPGDNNLS